MKRLEGQGVLTVHIVLTGTLKENEPHDLILSLLVQTQSILCCFLVSIFHLSFFLTLQMQSILFPISFSFSQNLT